MSLRIHRPMPRPPRAVCPEIPHGKEKAEFSSRISTAAGTRHKTRAVQEPSPWSPQGGRAEHISKGSRRTERRSASARITCAPQRRHACRRRPVSRSFTGTTAKIHHRPQDRQKAQRQMAANTAAIALGVGDLHGGNDGFHCGE